MVNVSGAQGRLSIPQKAQPKTIAKLDSQPMEATQEQPTVKSALPQSSQMNSSSFNLSSLLPLITDLLTSLLSVIQTVFSAGDVEAASADEGDGAVGAGGDEGAADNIQFSKDDALNYILGSTQGGKITQEASIFSSYANPNSRFANIGDTNEFDAVVAKVYASQFAGYAAGIDVVYNPGDKINTIADNIAQSQQLYNQLTPEAQLFADVASVYRGDFGNRGNYNHSVMKDLLVSWGRQDIANQSLVGVDGADAQTIGGIVKALNEEKDPATRQTWLQQIFDFSNNTPSSPSGAVPNISDYQNAINLVQSGAIDKLMENYNSGIGTTGPVSTSNNSQPDVSANTTGSLY
jgi:hypothetical protein